MLGNDVKRVYIYNTSDFQDFDNEIEVLMPAPIPPDSEHTSL